MSVTTQIIFPYMSDAHAPAMDIRMSPQDTAMALSFWQNLRSILIEADGYLEDYPYKPYSTLQNILCCHEAEKQNGHHSPYFNI